MRSRRGGCAGFVLHRVRSTCGVWKICCGGGGIARVVLPPSPPSGRGAFSWRAAPDAPPLVRRFMSRVERYLEGRAVSVRVPFDARGGTVFQRRVWNAMSRIPFGRTGTYGGIAKDIGAASACRAVGNACGANPLPIVIPCHRVIGAHGSGGFSAGTRWKRFLLSLEARPK